LINAGCFLRQKRDPVRSDFDPKGSDARAGFFEDRRHAVFDRVGLGKKALPMPGLGLRKRHKAPHNDERGCKFMWTGVLAFSFL
jgi:hypothetical protein